MTNIFVIGGCNLDVKAKTFAAHVHATSNPAAISTKPGGVGRNIAHNLARLGAKVALQSVVGNDTAADAILAATQSAGVDISSVRHLSGTSGTYLAILDQSGELVTAASDMRLLEQFSPEMLDWARIDAARFVVVDCNVRLDVMLVLANRVGSKLIVEPVSVSKCEKILQLQSIFLATPNADQWAVLSGASNIRNVVVHQGAAGAVVFQNGLETQIPAQTQKIVDVTGAGDAASAGLIYGLSQNMTLVEAAHFGQSMAARVIASEFSTLE